MEEAGWLVPIKRHWRVGALSGLETADLIKFRYTYEVCLFGQAMQKSNKGGGSHSLG